MVIKLILCPQCGITLHESVKFCPQCGCSIDKEKVDDTPVLNQVLEAAMLDYIKSHAKSSDNQIIGLECLKCGSKYNIVSYYHSEKISSTWFEGRRTTRITTKGIKVPLCNNCNQELLVWKNKHSSERSSIQDLICSNICLVIITFITLGSPYFRPWGVIIPILIFIAEIIYIGYRRSKKNKPDSPFRYIKFRGSTTYVRPQGVGPWVKYNTWLESIAY